MKVVLLQWNTRVRLVTSLALLTLSRPARWALPAWASQSCSPPPTSKNLASTSPKANSPRKQTLVLSWFMYEQGNEIWLENQTHSTLILYMYGLSYCDNYRCYPLYNYSAFYNCIWSICEVMNKSSTLVIQMFFSFFSHTNYQGTWWKHRGHYNNMYPYHLFYFLSQWHVLVFLACSCSYACEALCPVVTILKSIVLNFKPKLSFLFNALEGCTSFVLERKGVKGPHRHFNVCRLYFSSVLYSHL